MTLYDKYGGFAAISAIVHTFYDKVLASPTLDPYFQNVDMGGMIDHQTKFLCKVLGGPDNYTGRALEAAHRRLDVTSSAFEEVATLLKQSLEEAGVEPADVATVLGVVGSVRGRIVRTAAAS
jgi:hemoglobin